MTEARPTQKIRLVLSPQAERYARRDAPIEARLMAARGAMPLPPVEIATVLFALLHDPEPEVKELAGQSLAALPDGVCGAVLSGDVHPAILSYLARTHRDDDEKLLAVALNPRADDSTLVFLAALPHRRVVEVVANNQERLLGCSEIVDALGANPVTGRAVIDRIFSFLGIDADPGPEGDAGAPSDDEAEAALRAILGEDFSGSVRELVEEEDDGEVIDDAKASQLNLFALLQTLTVFQKIKLARMGNKEARGLLVRDRNKIVALAAVTSPKLTTNEAIVMAQSRNVCEDVLRIIARNRDWTRSYGVKLALSTNPKCPQTLAMKFVNYLQERDLWSIMKSKDVPTQVATHARRILMKKGKL